VLRFRRQRQLDLVLVLARMMPRLHAAKKSRFLGHLGGFFAVTTGNARKLHALRVKKTHASARQIRAEGVKTQTTAVAGARLGLRRHATFLVIGFEATARNGTRSDGVCPKFGIWGFKFR
jgi:hypothetical protein